MTRVTELLKSIGRRLLGRPARPKRKLGSRPTLEVLEDRMAPAVDVFTWKAAADGNWEDPNNWNGPAGQYPSTPNDVAQFNGVQSMKNVTIGDVMGATDITIGKLAVSGTYMGQINLKKSLIISNAQAAGESTFAALAKIAPQNTTSDLVVDGATLTVSKGTIGSTTNKSKIEVKNDGTLNFNLGMSVTVGMNIVVGTAAGGGGAGEVFLSDSAAGFQGFQLYLNNDVDITVNKDSLFYLNGKDGDGWIVDADGGATGIVTVAGTLNRGQVGLVKVDLPVLVKGTGTLSVNAPNDAPPALEAQLQITSNGQTGTNNASIYVESGGVLRLGTTVNTKTVRLIVADDIILDGGKMWTSANQQFIAANFVEFKNSAEYKAVRTDGGYSRLEFSLSGTTKKVKITSASFYLRVAADGSDEDSFIIPTGTLEISTTGTLLDVTMVGTSVPGKIWVLFSVAETITGDFATFAGHGAAFNREIWHDDGDFLRIWT